MKAPEGAFSLVEVLCAVLILGVGMVGLTHGLTTALHSSKESEVQTGAALVAASRIELLRADGYLVSGVEEGEAEQGSIAYHWEQSVTSTDLDGLYGVKISVRRLKSPEAVYELETLLFDPPLLSTSSSTTGGDRKKDGSTGRRRR